jgi:DNA-binding transcriptional ArsR family regulator
MRRIGNEHMDTRGLKELRDWNRVLSDGTRLRIVEQLARHELTVMEIARSLRTSQPLVSWHLHRLKQIGLVRMVRNGREVHCSLDHTRLQEYQRQFAALIADQ